MSARCLDVSHALSHPKSEVFKNLIENDMRDDNDDVHWCRDAGACLCV